MLVLAGLALALASCNGDQDVGEHASGTTTPIPSPRVSTVALPAGTWTGEVHEPAGPIKHYSARFTLPGARIQGERCFRLRLTARGANACTYSETYMGTNADGAFVFADSLMFSRGHWGCGPVGQTVLTPDGGILRYTGIMHGMAIAHGTLRLLAIP
jgi:hypothetical protein